MDVPLKVRNIPCPLVYVPGYIWGISLTAWSTPPDIISKPRLSGCLAAVFQLQFHNLPHLLCGLTRPVAAITKVCGSAAAFPAFILVRAHLIKNR
jgi:hypothetical protein